MTLTSDSRPVKLYRLALPPAAAAAAAAAAVLLVVPEGAVGDAVAHLSGADARDVTSGLTSGGAGTSEGAGGAGRDGGGKVANVASLVGVFTSELSENIS